MSHLEFYTDQASKQVLAGEQAVLENVRERCQRAAAAWSVLAAREKRSDDAREKRRVETAGGAGTTVDASNAPIDAD